MPSSGSHTIPTQVDGLTVTEKIADGGLSEVFLAYDGKTPVALKMLAIRLLTDRKSRRRMAQEGAMGLRLGVHANVIRTLDRRMDAGRPYLILEYFRSRCLRVILRQRKSLPVGEAAKIALQVAAGLGHIHAAGVIHRDIKPENVLIDDDNRVKIIDLGIGTTKLATLFPCTRSADGSPSYMAPEQIRKRRVDERSDLYSFGCMLYELIAGRPPFTSNNPSGLIQLQLDPNVRPKPLSAMSRTQDREPTPAGFEKLILACLEKDPNRRPPSVAGLIGELRKAARSPRA